MQRAVRDVLLVGHAQAFGWIDEWFGMDLAAVRRFEHEQQAAANSRITTESGEAPSAPVEVALDAAAMEAASD